MTSSFTLIPVCFSNLSSSGFRTFLSTVMLAPWLEAQYVSVFGESLEPPPSVEEPPPHAEAARASDKVTAPMAAARILRMAPGVPSGSGECQEGPGHANRVQLPKPLTA
ncbi:hypothetical protein SANTM175S_09925 [Streptomyces antimycoticus]